MTTYTIGAIVDLHPSSVSTQDFNVNFILVLVTRWTGIERKQGGYNTIMPSGFETSLHATIGVNISAPIFP
jgi:hypothetical protein